MSLACIPNLLDTYIINEFFSAAEQTFSTTAGKYSFGDEFTMADCCLVPQVFAGTIRCSLEIIIENRQNRLFLLRFGVNIDDFPIVKRVYENLLEHPAIIASHPQEQPDMP